MEVFVICVTAGHCSVALLTAEVINQQNIPWLYGPHDPAVSKDIAAQINCCFLRKHTAMEEKMPLNFEIL